MLQNASRIVGGLMVGPAAALHGTIDSVIEKSVNGWTDAVRAPASAVEPRYTAPVEMTGE